MLDHKNNHVSHTSLISLELAPIIKPLNRTLDTYQMLPTVFAFMLSGFVFPETDYCSESTLRGRTNITLGVVSLPIVKKKFPAHISIHNQLQDVIVNVQECTNNNLKTP